MPSMTELSLSVWCRKRSPASRRQRSRKQRTRLATAKQRVSELEVLLCKIYEDNILGKLSDSRYATLDAQYEKEQSELNAEISALEKAVKSYEKHEKDADRFIALIDKYENFDKLTIAMLNEFIEKILVHERDRKGSIQTTQEVEIYFNFVGRFVPPAFGEVELTPEELEEIRKREERKDRLHQNYLKRKASGAQKRYEDKIKAKKGRNRSQESRHSCRGHCKGSVRPRSAVYRRKRADERSTNSMNITYTQNGDYLIPNIIIRKTKPLGHYGRLRKAYLKMHRPILFNELVLSDRLFEHCAEIDEAAQNRMELIVPQLAKQYGVTEGLKAENQMEWVRQMNACKAQAEEVVKAELIYD